MRSKLRVMLLVPHYLPGYRAGGPIRSIANLVQTLGDEIDFRIITSDRDLGSAEPYQKIIPDIWLPVGKAQVMYLSPKGQSVKAIMRLLQQTEYDVLYLNSFFARRFSILPMWLRYARLLPSVPTLLAPRGEFSRSALSLKPWRKRLYMQLAFRLRLYRTVVWHASSEFERQDILRAISSLDESIIITAKTIITEASWDAAIKASSTGSVLVAPDIANSSNLMREVVRRSAPKKPGRLQLLFLSRVARMKNLAGALRYLAGVRGEITFDIYGPIEDTAYWQECQALIAQLPSAIQVRQHGEVSHDEVPAIMAQHDLFLLPTLGENFGHAIQEALLSGCPVLISDRTPWRNLEGAQAGFDVSLEQPERWREALQFFVDMDEPTHRQWRTGARAYGAQTATSPEAIEQNRRLFATVAALAEKARHEARRT